MPTSSSRFHLPLLLQRHACTSILPAAVLVVVLGACAAGQDAASEPAPEPEKETPAADNSALDIVQRSLDFHGSELLETSTVTLTVTSKSGSFKVASQPGSIFDYTVFSDDKGKPNVRRHTNKTGEPEVTHTVDGESVEIADPQKVRDFVSARNYFLLFPYRLFDPNTVLTDLGVETWEGKEFLKVKLSFDTGTSTYAAQSFLFWFDPATAQLEQFAYSFDGGVRLRKLINPRRVGGVLIADQENYAHNADVSVDVVTPDFAPEMALLSTVTLTDVSIEPRKL